MALYVRQTENKTEMQKRLADELQERARIKAEAADLPDGVDDSQFIKGTKQTTSLLGVWLILAVAAIGLVVFLIIKTAQ
jgi:uncharacterized protein HemX